MRRLVFSTFCAAGFLLTAFQSTTTRTVKEYPTPDVREEQQVVVGGVTETWQLKWTSPPKPKCGTSDLPITCPCMGFAYGESGDMVLIRLRNGVEIYRLPLAPLFDLEFLETRRAAIVQRWAMDYEKDNPERSSKPDFPAIVAKRPIVQVMHFADYDHDGEKSEFYLQTEAAPCGKNVGVLIGLSSRNPRLHVFGTASKPASPLRMQESEWEALREAKGPTEVTDWPCGDHGAETETRLRLHWTSDGVDGTRRAFTCPPKARRLIRESPL